MVIEAYSPRRPTLPHSKQSPPPAPGVPIIASPTDRLAAGIIDWVVVLSPILVAISAPLKRTMVEAVVLNTQSPFMQALAIAVVAAILLLVCYQTLFIYFYGGTPGKLAFGLRVVDVWHHRRPSLGASLVRAGVYLGEIFLLGLPWLSVFGNTRRRPIHDRLADTVVISTKRPGASAPGFVEATFVGSVYSALLAMAVLATVVTGMEILKRMENEESVLAWMDGDRDRDSHCEAVDDAAKTSFIGDSAQDRMELGMELFAAGVIDQTCLSQEADVALNEPGGESGLAYLAKAFANADNGDLSNDYLAKACELGPQSEACMMTTIVQNWSDENWDQVAELFSALPTPASPHVTVWKVRYFMKQGKFEQALQVMESLDGRPALASYMVPERVKALWRSHRLEEARLVATTGLETLAEKERLSLSGWLCYEELSRQCSESHPLSCEHFVQEAHRQTEEPLHSAGWLAMILLKEKCDNLAAPEAYEALREATGETGVQTLLGILTKWSKGTRSQARTEMADFIKEEGVPDALRNEGLRRLVMWSESTEELAGWIKHWEELKPGPRRAVGPTLFQALRQRGKLDEALSIGWQLLDENRTDLQMNRDLVVAAYQLGRRKDAWKLLRSYRERYDVLNQGRSPASTDEFVAVAKMLSKEFGAR